MFKLDTRMKPAGDQPQAIEKLTEGLNNGLKHQVLLGVTGSGKTYTVANVIANVQKPTLVIAHNKTLAAQLTSEFRELFPESAVEYFVSYYDYYQPEAYMPNSDTYIEKEATINEEIDRLRHAATQAVLTRRDVIIVASVSCIYGLGSPAEYLDVTITLKKGDTITREGLIERLIKLNYQRSDIELKRGYFRTRGDTIEIVPSNGTTIWRIALLGDYIEKIEELNPVTMTVISERRIALFFPAKHFVTPERVMDKAFNSIKDELEQRLKILDKGGRLLEAERLRRRTNYDLEMIKEVGYCNGIENYSRHFDQRQAGEPPSTLIDYFPDDFLMIIDESHVTVSQLNAMYAGDLSRKDMLIEHGFRLPSAKDNRPLKFDEFENKVNQVIYTSATPGPYEFKKTEQTVEQIIRPTGLIDPELILKPSTGQVPDLMERVKDRVTKNERVLVTTLTKKMAEELTEYMQQQGIKVRYLHSDVETLERIEIIRDLRKGNFDVLIGVNLLREGLDLPEVSLVAILDADKEGFLRSETALIQTIGRAARHLSGQVMLYADNITGSLRRAIDETNRRRVIQQKYLDDHHITATTIKKEVGSIIEAETREPEFDAVEKGLLKTKTGIEFLIKEKEREMKHAAQELQFELAAILRDELIKLQKIKKNK